ncbi:hypothetical protein PV08_03391 [Exophiala spinifera]|uniref:Peptidase C14 caspase domain-containing protein n=1 Tax=Exophiala spinifera TaxID=91928 RepID=A0A0D2C6B7_9EURO|nr:uncharacterized protein PV08_03391 [Exophiala spinifera]KIW19099.1 hypothetical protein PV08_03391 [Exophiala spinifera]
MSKKALLISSVYGALKGPQNDVEKMAQVLGDLGFVISLCCGTGATRAGILTAWEQLIDNIGPGDSIVIYYSGHGGTVQSPRSVDGATHSTFARDRAAPWKYQYLVPVDFGERENNEFRGILDVEMSHLLHAMTEKTRNVTTILDCCFAGGMVRDPGLADTAVPKGVPSTAYADVVDHVNSLRARGWSLDEAHVDENPLAVRIAAATASETAWEYQNSRGEWRGAMTEALESVLAASKGNHISWRTLLLRVSEMVTVQFPYQHPQVEGPRNRLTFSVQEIASQGFHVREEDDRVAIQAGRVSGVHKGSIYSVVPIGAEKPVVGQELASARVTYAGPFKAYVELRPGTASTGGLPPDGALAFLQHDAVYKWPVTLPVTLPADLTWLPGMVEASRFIRPAAPDDGELILAEFKKDSDTIFLFSNRGHVVATLSANAGPDERRKLVRRAERLARGRHLLSLNHETDVEILRHAVNVTFGVVDAGPLGGGGRRGRTIRQDGGDDLREGDSVYVELVNCGVETVFVWVFDVNAGGKVSRVSRSNSTGIEMPPGRHEVLGSRNDGLGLKGLPVSWPEDLPRTTPLEETLVFIFTSSPVDLHHLSSDPGDGPPPSRTGLSHLEQLTYSIATGAMRAVTLDEDSDPIRYSISYIPFRLHPHPL